MCIIKYGVGIGLALSLLVGCATTDDPSHDGSLWEAMVNVTTGKYEERAKKQQEELEKSRREREQAEEEHRRLKAQQTKPRPNE
jgi:hypothetical protein